MNVCTQVALDNRTHAFIFTLRHLIGQYLSFDSVLDVLLALKVKCNHVCLLVNVQSCDNHYVNHVVIFMECLPGHVCDYTETQPQIQSHKREILSSSLQRYN